MTVRRGRDTLHPATASYREISAPPARLAIAAAAATLVLLASLHVLSPEFDPSWRVVSEYANGRYGWVLALMFFSWGISSWALAFGIWWQVRTTAGKLGLAFLFVAGVGEAMASIFDINHDVMHNVAGILGVLGLPIAAILISTTLGRTQPWSTAKKTLLWTAQLPWISVVLMAVAFAVFVGTHTGRTALVGWANRLLIVAYCVWVMTVAWQALKLRGATS